VKVVSQMMKGPPGGWGGGKRLGPSISSPGEGERGGMGWSHRNEMLCGKRVKL